MDFNEDLLNSFNINPKAIIIQTDDKVNIKSKLFNGINIIDYQIVYDNTIYGFNQNEYKKFDKKLLYESTINGKKYEDVMKQTQIDNVKIVNLIGKNGVINNQEYKTNDITFF